MLLLDEFQDTDPIQLEIAAAPDRRRRRSGAPTARRCVPVPGRLFVVGDPKQSIYRFRRADIATYLAAGGRMGARPRDADGQLPLVAAVIDWVNGVFGDVIQAADDVQPAYRAARHVPPGAPWTTAR